MPRISAEKAGCQGNSKGTVKLKENRFQGNQSEYEVVTMTPG